jgi:hypothetical protein
MNDLAADLRNPIPGAPLTDVPQPCQPDSRRLVGCRPLNSGVNLAEPPCLVQVILGRHRASVPRITAKRTLAASRELRTAMSTPSRRLPNATTRPHESVAPMQAPSPPCGGKQSRRPGRTICVPLPTQRHSRHAPRCRASLRSHSAIFTLIWPSQRVARAARWLRRAHQWSPADSAARTY